MSIRYEIKDPAKSLIHCFTTWEEPEPGHDEPVKKELLIGYIRRAEDHDEYYFHSAEGCNLDELLEIGLYMKDELDK